MKKNFLLLLLSVHLLGCDGSSAAEKSAEDVDISDDTTSDKDEFQFSAECEPKVEEEPENVVMRQIYSSIPLDDLDNLHCLTYAVEEGELLIDIINYWANCSGPYGGDITVDGDTVRASISKFSCNDNANCTCPYHFSFPVSGINTDEDILFEIAEVSCDEEMPPEVMATTLPLGTKQTGMACVYHGRSGDTLHGVCTPTSDAENGGCPDDLICDLGPTYHGETEVCHAPCEENADCVPEAAFRCVDGICRIDNPLLSVD